MRVNDLMKQPVISCNDTQSLNEAAQRMWEEDLGILPVTDESGKLCGVVTDRDICMAAYTQGRPLAEIPVASAMSRLVFSCHATDAIEAAERTMADRQVHRLPVIDDAQRPIGMITVNDVAKAMTRSRNGGKDLALQTYAAIARPREPRPI